MGFRLEVDMIEPVHSWLSSQVEHVKTEFRTPWGYCDLVGCTLSRRRVSKRLGLHQRESIGSLEKVDLLWQVPDEGSGHSTDAEKLAACYAPWRDSAVVVEDIALLEERGFVVRDSKGGLQKRNGWFPLHKRLIAIEAKLTRVEESMWQAARHLAYADESYVALPSRLAWRTLKSRREGEFRQLGIGLLAVTDQAVRVLIKSRNPSDRDPVLQAHCVERFWRLQVTGNST